MKIHNLSQEVVNQIAAGEVVERPSHLVKELIENSLDANCSYVHIEIAAGGRYVKVSDDGHGISKDDLVLALTRHATSKISVTDDLWKLSTYGFRGEALASAAAVSKLTLISQTPEQAIEKNQAYGVRSDHGQISSLFPAQKSKGTEIKIEALFENVPARLKFLKSDAAEFAQIRNVVKAMSLAYPHIEFKLINNGKLDLIYTNKNDHQDRVKEVLGLKNIYTHSADRDGYKTVAYFSDPQEVEKTSKNIWIFAQNRWIQDRGLQAAVTEAYRSLLMHGEFPSAAIFLFCRSEDIDVNIHPTKSQVKFHDQSLAFRSVHAAVRDGLVTAPWIPSKSSSLMSPESFYLDAREHNFIKQENQAENVNLKFNDIHIHQTYQNKKNFDFSIDKSISLKSEEPALNEQVKNKNAYWSTFDVLGQANQTYILCQKDQNLILVDQHAAHERVAFEKLMLQWKNSKDKIRSAIDKQSFLFPLAIDLSAEKVESLLKYQQEISHMGIEIESLGPSTIGIKSAPSFIKESVFPQVFEKMSQDIIDHGGSYQLDKVVGDIFATIACHSVVRAGQALSVNQMKELLIEMDDFPLSSFCPHGRPVSIEFSFSEIEKKFGRIK